MKRTWCAIAILAILAVVPVVAGLVRAESSVASGAAGGGGVFAFGGEKVSFGFHLSGSEWEHSGFTFHGRDADATLRPYSFTDVRFEDSDGRWSALAEGWVSVNDRDDFWFQLQVTDKGQGSADVFHLSVYHDEGSPKVMDPEDLLFFDWFADGLDGGNIWVTPPSA